MNKVKIITDSTADLTQELYEKLDITVLPLYVTIGEKTYKDGIEITAKELYKKVNEHNQLPKTSAVSPIVFEEEFKKYIDLGYDVLYLGIGSEFSGTFNNARIAASNFPKDRIRLVDSANLSSGIGLLLLKANQFKEKGLGLLEIASKLERIVPNIKTQFAINTLEYLHKGGRCSGTTRLIGTLLKVKPIIRVVDGGMIVAKKPRGKFEKALDTMLEYVDHDLENIDRDFIMITHSLANEDEKYLREQLKTRGFADNNIYETFASCTISTHCGPRTIGILYIVNN